jgi:hypothetical protein
MTGPHRIDDGDAGRVVPAHRELSTREQLLVDRRSLYRLALELIGGQDAPVPDAVLDHPLSRYRIGEVLAGRAPVGRLRLAAAGELGDGGAPALVADPEAQRALAPALRSVAAETGATGSAVGLITRADGGRHARVAAEVGAGLRRAAELVPELFADVVGHVDLIGVLDPDRSHGVVSASSRHVPGLVLLRSGDPLEVAESFLHEAAHQRLFDLAITRDLLVPEADAAAGFRPSWRRASWPIEQTLAAFHAYACLAELAGAAAEEVRRGVGPLSVLPTAGERAAEIGQWLAGHTDLLGADAERLVLALLGEPIAAQAPSPAPGVRRDGSEPVYRVQDCRVRVAADGRWLVGVPGEPPRLFWLAGDAVSVLEILRSAGSARIGRIVGEFGARAGSGDATARVSGALATLVHADLAEVG